jgi:hypothetical protein
LIARVCKRFAGAPRKIKPMCIEALQEQSFKQYNTYPGSCNSAGPMARRSLQ